MSAKSEEVVRYKRSRFSTRLPATRRYTRSHYWLTEQQPGVWRVGFTKFATRMLGDLVEYSFAVHAHDRVEIGREIGWIEGFKAVTDIYCVVGGEFVRSNPELEQDITVAESDPYGAGWLYEVQGTERPESVDVNGYVAILDATIEKMLKSRHERGEDD